MTPFNRTAKGNYFARFGEIPVTVFTGKYGGWCYFIAGERGDTWYDTADDAMAAAIEAVEALRVPACLKFFGLAPPVSVDALKARYRELAKSTHPDHGGTCAAFKTVQSYFEAALSLVGGAA